MRLPRFAPVNGFSQTDPIEEQVIALTDEIAAAFETVKDAEGLIWDVRANTGGASPVGFQIVGGMPGLREVPIARCTTRIPDTVPAEYYHHGPDYDLEAHPRFSFSGPVAVLIDGRSFSAADYFARAVQLGTDALLIGSATAGAYGGSGATFQISESPNLVAAYDPYRCNDADGSPLETRGVKPDVEVRYAPADLAAGTDTVMERAARELHEQ